MIELGVFGLNREFGASQSGHATVTASEPADCHWRWRSISGKAQASDELEPGELPD